MMNLMMFNFIPVSVIFVHCKILCKKPWQFGHTQLYDGIEMNKTIDAQLMQDSQINRLSYHIPRHKVTSSNSNKSVHLEQRYVSD